MCDRAPEKSRNDFKTNPSIILEISEETFQEAFIEFKLALIPKAFQKNNLKNCWNNLRLNY